VYYFGESAINLKWDACGFEIVRCMRIILVVRFRWLHLWLLWQCFFLLSDQVLQRLIQHGTSGAARMTVGDDDDLTHPIEGAAVSHGEIVPASASSYYLACDRLARCTILGKIWM